MPIDEEKPTAPNEEAPESQEDERPSVTASDEDGSVQVRLPEKKSRRERRAEADPIRQRDSEIDRLNKEVQEMRGWLMRQSSGQQVQPPAAAPAQEADPHRSELSNIRQEQEYLSTAIRTTQDPAEVRRLKDRFYDLEERKESIREERLEQKWRRSQPQVQQRDPEEAILRSEFPEVFGSEQAMLYARGVFHQLRAEGKPEHMGTAREAMRKAAERFGFAKPAAPAPSPTQQQRWGGVPAQAGARSAPGGTKLLPFQMKLATARYSNLEPEQAYVRWATEVLPTIEKTRDE
jgi:hypothetical protein